MSDSNRSEADLGLPDKLADEMIRRLFRSDGPNSTDRILYPGIGHGDLSEATERYCERHNLAVPEGVAVETNEHLVEEAREKFPSLEILHVDFLGELPEIGSFDYIVSNPPMGQLRSASPELRKDYAMRFDTISASGSMRDEDLYLMFLEQSLHLLAAEGRLVFITPDYANRRGHRAIPEIKQRLSMFHIEDIDEVSVSSAFEDISLDVVLTVVSQVEPIRDFAVNVDFDSVQSALTIEHDIGVSDIATGDPVVFNEVDSVHDVRINLARNDFDAAPVLNSESKECIGLVTRADLTVADSGQLKDGYIEELGDDQFLTRTASFADVVDKLAARRFCLVGSEDDIRGIVTRFDLNSMNVFFHLYAKFAQFEIGLRNTIRDHGVDWENALIESGKPNHRIKKLNRRYGDKAALSQDVFDIMSLSDLIGIVENSRIGEEIGIEEINAETTLSMLSPVRNVVAHYQPLVHTLDTINFSGRRTAADFAEVYDGLNESLDMLRSYNYV